MAETYPAALPCFLRATSWKRVENIANSSLANGEIFGRKLYTSTPRIHEVSLFVNAAQLKVWEDFVETTLGDTKSFNAPIVTKDTEGNFDSSGKPTTLTEVRLQTVAYSVSQKTKTSFEVSGIRLREV